MENKNNNDDREGGVNSLSEPNMSEALCICCALWMEKIGSVMEGMKVRMKW
ncbi:hypothetical protein SOVF_035630 [Spinacia oleracea]|nr:hypothetical protein SOVF_035630 [Spinacia oleracea]